jgi:hypothetical protein
MDFLGQCDKFFNGETGVETSVNFYQAAQRNITEDGYLHTSRRENLKSHQQNYCFMYRLLLRRKALTLTVQTHAEVRWR